MSSLIEIQNQIALLQRQADEIRTGELAQAVQEILAKMDLYGISVDDLDYAKGRIRKAGGKSGNPAPVKFRGPNGETWTGRGLTPKWLTSLIATGSNRDDFLVAV